MDRTGPQAPARRSRSLERGAAMVELALAAPVLISLLLGTVTSAAALNDNLQLTHAAREGARHGATVPYDETFSSGTWAEVVRVVVIDRFGEGLTTSEVCVALVTGAPATPISTDHSTNTDGSACYQDSSGVTDARVQVTVTKPASIDTGFYAYDFDLSSEATAKHESNG